MSLKSKHTLMGLNHNFTFIININNKNPFQLYSPKLSVKGYKVQGPAARSQLVYNFK